MNTSPFRAGFGKTPPVLVGRDGVLEAFGAALEEGTWSLERITLIEGLRGVGKTVLINALEDIAQARGWVVVSESATPGMVDRIAQDHLARVINRLDPPPSNRVSGITLGPGAIAMQPQAEERFPTTLRSQLERVAELVAPRGILITVDEVSSSAMPDLAQFATEIQHAVRQDLEVAFVGAGLHDAVTDLLSEPGLTFLRRAARTNIGLLTPEDVIRALRKPIRDAGREIGSEALDYAMRATQGYPFMAQLIGDFAWKAQPEQDLISLADVRAAYPRAKRLMGTHIHARALSDLSATDRTVLAHMSLVDGPSTVVDLRNTLGVSKQHLNNYRQRLLDAGMIFSPQRGQVDFALPYLRDYLREHTVTDAAGGSSTALGYPPPPGDPDDTETT